MKIKFSQDKVQNSTISDLDKALTWQVIEHELVSIPNQIDKNITRTAFSPLINEYKDYAVGIVDIAGKLISQSRGSLLIFAANALGTAVADGLAIYGESGLSDGDIVISNHVGTLGQHLNNVVMYTPIRIGPRKTLLGFFCVLMHWIDVGGSMVGSCSSTITTELFQEGIQFRTVKLMEAGERREDMFRMIEYNTRFPKLLLGDVGAQITACFKGRDYVAELGLKYGVETVLEAVDDMWLRAEHRVRAAIRNAPDGVYKAFSFLDSDGIRPDVTVPVGVEVTVRGETITVDFSGVADQLPGPLNAGRNGGAVAAARIATKFLFSPETPVNEGDFRALTVEIPEGKFLSAGPTAPVGSSGNMIPTVVDTVLRAMYPAFPERVAAGHHGTYGMHAFHGKDLLTGAPFYHLDTCVGGWGATAATDGYGPSRSIVHGDTSDVPVEMQEALYPYRFESYALRTDSAGAGRRRGGLGVVKTYQILAPCRLNLKIDRTKCSPWGFADGLDGCVGEVEIHRVDGPTERVLKGDYALSTGDRVVLRTAGGGGYGDPFEREVPKVAEDVAAGYVSVQAALTVYGVATGPDGAVDAEATAIRRTKTGVPA